MRSLYRAFFPKPRHTVLGRRLQPFSNWHRLQLMAADSPFAGGSKPRDLRALAVAVTICATSYPRVTAPMDMLETLLHRRALRAARRDPQPALDAWISYQRNHGGFPRFFQRQQGKLCLVPGPAANWAALRSHGYGDAEAWNMPVDQAAWAKAALAEADGADINLMTEATRLSMIKQGWGPYMPDLLEEDA